MSHSQMPPLPEVSVDAASILQLPHQVYPEGTFTIAENGDTLPFAVERVFYVYDIPTDTERGGHAHWELQELIVAASGCFDVSVCDGERWRTFTLRRPHEGLHIPAGLWIRLNNFSAGSVCLVMCSTAYDASDYLRGFDEFVSCRRGENQ